MPLFRQAPYFEVNNTNYGDGHVEGGKGSDKRNILIGIKKLDSAFGVVSHTLLAIEKQNERSPKNGRHDPAERDGDADLAAGATRSIDDGPREREVAIQRDQ